MKKHELKADKRDVIGRKVKTLRKVGSIPGTVYGRNVKSLNVAVAVKSFQKVYEETGATGLIELSLGSGVRPVLVHKVQRHPVTDAIVHVEFHQVDLKEKVHAKVPLELVGESAAVVQKVGTVLTIVDEVEVEALPTDLPEKIEVDISALSEVGQELKVTDLVVPKSVTILTDQGLTVVKIGALVSKAAEAEMAEEAAKAAEKAAEAPQEAGEEAVAKGDEAEGKESAEEKIKPTEPQAK